MEETLTVKIKVDTAELADFQQMLDRVESLVERLEQLENTRMLVDTKHIESI